MSAFASLGKMSIADLLTRGQKEEDEDGRP